MNTDAIIQSIRSNRSVRRIHLRDDELLVVLGAFDVKCDLRMHREAGDVNIGAAVAVTVLGAAGAGTLAYLLLGGVLTGGWLALGTLTAAAAGGATASRLVGYQLEIRLLPGETAELSAKRTA